MRCSFLRCLQYLWKNNVPKSPTRNRTWIDWTIYQYIMSYPCGVKCGEYVSSLAVIAALILRVSLHLLRSGYCWYCSRGSPCSQLCQWCQFTEMGSFLPSHCLSFRSVAESRTRKLSLLVSIKEDLDLLFFFKQIQERFWAWSTVRRTSVAVACISLHQLHQMLWLCSSIPDWPNSSCLWCKHTKHHKTLLRTNWAILHIENRLRCLLQNTSFKSLSFNSYKIKTSCCKRPPLPDSHPPNAWAKMGRINIGFMLPHAVSPWLR